jgi:TRAP-type transport system periplasmic protein
MKKTVVFLLSILILACMIVPGCTSTDTDTASPTETTDQPQIFNLKAVTFLPLYLQRSKEFIQITERINEQTEGKVNIEVIGGPEAVPPMEQAEALRKGTVDAALLPVNYYESLLPEAIVFHLSQLSPAEERESGFYDYMVERHKEFGMYYLGRTRHQDPMFVYTNEKVSEPADLAGQKIGRSNTLGVPFLEELGATIVNVQAGDMYTSMERGVVDGVMHPLEGAGVMSFGEVAKYVIDHPVYVRNSTLFLLNLDTWNELPDDIKSTMQDVIIDWENERKELDVKENEGYREVALEAGMEFITFSEEDAEYYTNLAYQIEWDIMKEINPDLYNTYRDLLNED